MQVKRFVAADMRRALELVRHELGADAVILSNRRTGKGVEIMASLEEPRHPDTSIPQHLAGVEAGQFDLPMASDEAWQHQAVAATVADQFSHEAAPRAAASVAKPRAHHRGAASGKTHEELALEVEQARARMLAAKQGEGEQTRAAPTSTEILTERAPSRPTMPQRVQRQFEREAPQAAAHYQQDAQQASAPHVPQYSQQQDSRQQQQQNSQQQHQYQQQNSQQQQRQHQQQDSQQQQQQQQQQRAVPAQHLPAQPQMKVELAYPSANYQQQSFGAQQTIVNARFNQPMVEAAAKEQTVNVERKAPHPAPVKPQLMDVDDKMKVLMAELSDMRGLLEEQLAQSNKQGVTKNPVKEAIKTRLAKLGLSQQVSTQVLAKIKPSQSIKAAWSDSLAALSKSIPVCTKDVTDHGGVFAFVGPTGGGKTTTVGKLAARYVMKHGADQVALITTDTYRIAAHDQLRALGAILKVPVKVVAEDESLKDIIDSFSNRSLILIDTAGFRHGDPMLHQQLALVQQHRSVRSYLVMAANNQWQMLKASAYAYAGRGLSGAVLTKLDETSGLGEALSVIIEHDLPLAYSTNGQNIPQDIDVADAHYLVDKANELGFGLESKDASIHKIEA